MATKQPAIPEISDATIKRALVALKEIVEVGINRRGDPLDRFVSVRTLKTLIVENAEIVELLATGHKHDPIELTERSADPADPEEGHCKIWQSDGTDSGNDGDVMALITAGGVTKTKTLITF